MSSRIASAIHLPDALIHKTPSSFMEVLPVLACVNSGLLPTHADSSRSGVSSAWLVVDRFLLIDSPIFILRAALAVVPLLTTALQSVRIEPGESGQS